MQELQSRNDIVATDTNKGEAFIIQDFEDQVKEAEKQLKNKEKYETLKYGPTNANNETVIKLYQNSKKNIR